jgi:hypothetical protein
MPARLVRSNVGRSAAVLKSAILSVLKHRMADGLDSNPRDGCPPHAFQACAFDRSATPPGCPHVFAPAGLQQAEGGAGDEVGWTSRSRISPSLSTARHRYMRRPRI